MHLVFRSSKAKGDWSFRWPRHSARIKAVTAKFSKKHGVRVLSAAMAVTGKHRWSRAGRGTFWDYRTFTRVVQGFRAWLGLRDYLRLNELEGQGCDRINARFLLGPVRGHGRGPRYG